jgi:transposase
VAIWLERNQGPLVSALRTYDFLVLFPINPLTLARYRDAFTPSRAKDDPTDAALQLALRRTHRDTLQPLQPQRPAMRALAQLVAHRRRVVGDTVRSTNRLPRTLKNSFPHVLHGFQETDTAIFCDCLRRWSTRKAAPLAPRSTRDTFCREPHVRYADVIAPRIPAIKSATPLTTDAGVIAPHALLGQALVAQLRVTWQALADCDTAIAQCAQNHPACSLFQALPGAGPVFASRRLVACGAQRERSAAAAALQK